MCTIIIKIYLPKSRLCNPDDLTCEHLYTPATSFFFRSFLGSFYWCCHCQARFVSLEFPFSLSTTCLARMIKICLPKSRLFNTDGLRRQHVHLRQRVLRQHGQALQPGPRLQRPLVSLHLKASSLIVLFCQYICKVVHCLYFSICSGYVHTYVCVCNEYMHTCICACA